MMNKSILTRILVADHCPIFRWGLAAIIQRELDMTVVEQVGDGYEAIKFFRQKRPDVLLLDLQMPTFSSVATIKTICRDFKNAGILLLSTYKSDEDIYQGIEAGAKGCLFKDTEPDELLQAIRTVSYGKKYIPSTLVVKLKGRINKHLLSDRELETLNLIVSGKNNQEIALNLHITEGTVKFHVSNIFVKLEVHNRTQAVLAGIKRGIVQF